MTAEEFKQHHLIDNLIWIEAEEGFPVARTDEEARDTETVFTEVYRCQDQYFEITYVRSTEVREVVPEEQTIIVYVAKGRK